MNAASATTPSRANPFRPATVLAVLAVGAAAFLLLLYALGTGLDGRDDRNGGAHAASTGLNGYAALARLLEAQGHEVSLSRTPVTLSEEVLLVLTPDGSVDAEELSALLERRLRQGPTLLILPKWTALPLPDDPRIKAENGWVDLAGAAPPVWAREVTALADIDLALGQTASWQGLDLTGTLPDADQVQAATGYGRAMLPLVRDAEGDLLAGYWNRNGYHPMLADAGSLVFSAEEEDAQDDGLWPLVVVIEPDLLNNFGMADETRARLAAALVDAALEDYDLPVAFDLTLPGLGRSQNLLTLAFTPPFLAATLCLLLAALVIAWRGFRRFAPPRGELPPMAQGKSQLARNGAALVERARRLHLLGAPYAALVAARMADALGLREKDAAEREEAIDRALIARGHEGPGFAATAAAIRSARRPHELLRGAYALRSLERTLEK